MNLWERMFRARRSVQRERRGVSNAVNRLDKAREELARIPLGQLPSGYEDTRLVNYARGFEKTSFAPREESPTDGCWDRGAAEAYAQDQIAEMRREAEAGGFPQTEPAVFSRNQPSRQTSRSKPLSNPDATGEATQPIPLEECPDGGSHVAALRAGTTANGMGTLRTRMIEGLDLADGSAPAAGSRKR